jgi:hypothetical protein
MLPNPEPGVLRAAFRSPIKTFLTATHKGCVLFTDWIASGDNSLKIPTIVLPALRGRPSLPFQATAATPRAAPGHGTRRLRSLVADDVRPVVRDGAGAQVHDLAVPNNLERPGRPGDRDLDLGSTGGHERTVDRHARNAAVGRIVP